MKKLIFLKLGGSLITDKTKPYTANLEVVKDLARQIKKAIIEDKDISLVIGNGAGSYGHYAAEQYKMMEGITDENQKKGFCIVQDAVGRLNRLIIQELLHVGVNAVSIQPSSIIVAKNKKIQQFYLDPLLHFVSLGIVPVLYGDIVFDQTNGSSIFSTEQLLGEIARRLVKKSIHVLRLIHVGTTQGVLDQKGKCIPIIQAKNLSELKKYFYAPEGFDVTGGMFHKVKEAVTLVRSGIETFIIGNNTHENLYHALTGKLEIGTIIR